MTRHRIPLAILTTILVTTLLAPAAPASAQDLDAIAGRLELAGLDGIRNAASRTYAADIQTLVSTPTASTGTPLVMLALVAEFDTSDHAEKAAGTIQDRLATQLTDAAGADVKITEAPSYGDDAWQFSGIRLSAGDSLALGGFIVQRGRWLTLTLAIATGDSAMDAATALMDATLAFRLSTDKVVYDVNGASHGGIWDKLPGRNAAEALSGTQPIYDNQLVPPARPDAEG